MLVQNRCSFHGLRSEDLIQHLKDFLRIVDSIDLNGYTKNTTRLRLFHFSLHDQAINWLDHLPAGSISTWDDLTTRFLAQFFPPGRTAELRNDILMFQQRQDESLYDAWTRFKDLLLKVPHHGLDLWLQVQIFYDHVDYTTQMAIDYAAGGRLRKLRPEWETIKDLAQYKVEGWNDPIILEEGSLDYENPNLEQLLGVMECKVSTLMEKAISLMGRSESIFAMSNNMMHQLPPELSRQEAFEDLVMNFILDQEERVKKLEEYMCVIGSDFMQLSSEVVGKLKEEIRMEENRTKKIEKITKYPDTEDLDPLNGHKFLEALTEKASFHTPKFVSPKSLGVKYVRTIFPSPPLVRESTFGFKPGTNNNQYVKSRYKVENPNPQSTPQVLPSLEEYTPPVTHPEEVEETIGIPMEVEPIHEPQLEDLGLNTCNHDIPLSSRKVPSFDEPKPQPHPLPNCPPLGVNLGDKRGTDPPINSHSP
ncbi:zinc finger, CCHC-type containing protein [Tanacetum coccineum]